MIPSAMLLASFTQPESIGTTALSLLWMVPLTAAIAVVYKVTKVRVIRGRAFVRECALLFASILVFLVVAGVILLLIAWFFNDLLPVWRGIAV